MECDLVVGYQSTYYRSFSFFRFSPLFLGGGGGGEGNSLFNSPVSSCVLSNHKAIYVRLDSHGDMHSIMICSAGSLE